MKTKKKTRFFAIQCCKIWVELPEEDFTYDGGLDYYCHKHPPKVIVDYLTWKGGFEEEALKQWKKKQEETNECKDCKDS